jgi:hypothetical protein
MRLQPYIRLCRTASPPATPRPHVCSVRLQTPTTTVTAGVAHYRDSRRPPGPQPDPQASESSRGSCDRDPGRPPAGSHRRPGPIRPPAAAEIVSGHATRMGPVPPPSPGPAPVPRACLGDAGVGAGIPGLCGVCVVCVCVLCVCERETHIQRLTGSVLCVCASQSGVDRGTDAHADTRAARHGHREREGRTDETQTGTETARDKEYDTHRHGHRQWHRRSHPHAQTPSVCARASSLTHAPEP